MYWKMTAHYAAPGEVYNNHVDAPAYGVTANAGGSLINLQEPEDPLTLAYLAKGDGLGISFIRNGTNALDTIDNVVSLFGILFTYIAEQ